ncbi:hypothetical protein [Modestobacter lapidis]|nr:hypothetical protein [Modestobacter lapidis]
MSTGPFLYDDDPAPLHTGEPRQRRGLLVALLGSTVLIAVLMVGGILFFKGSGEEQSREVATVFTAALSQGDVETAYDLLCDDERARLLPEELADAYLQEGTPAVVGAAETEHDDGPAQLVDVRWGEGAGAVTTELLVVPEGGTKVCGTSAG